MKDLICLLDNNNIKYFYSKYGYDIDCIVIKKNNYKLEIYYKNGYVSDLEKIPYTWGRMGSTSLDMIIDDLRNYLKIDLFLNEQLSLF